MFRSPLRFLLIGIAFLTPLTVQADIYKYVDRAGRVFYTDNPTHGGFKRIIESPPEVTITLGNTGSYSFRPVERSRPVRRAAYQAPRFEPLPAEIEQIVQAAGSRYNVDPALLHAMIRVESSYKPRAVSNKGAMGLMQLMPATAARYGVRDPYDPMDNISGGAAYLSDLISMFPSDLRLAVAAYNAGENNVIKYGNRIPPFHETQNYVERVLNHYNNNLQYN